MGRSSPYQATIERICAHPHWSTPTPNTPFGHSLDCRSLVDRRLDDGDIDDIKACLRTLKDEGVELREL